MDQTKHEKVTKGILLLIYHPSKQKIYCMHYEVQEKNCSQLSDEVIYIQK
jgi:hypothetical protein